MGRSGCTCSESFRRYHNVWRLQGHDQPGSEGRQIPNTEYWWPVHQSIWRTTVHNTWPKQRCSTSGHQWRVAQTNDHTCNEASLRVCTSPYGVSSAPGIYQRIMEQLLHNIPMTIVYLDDILVSGSTPEDHERNLQTFLTRFHDKGLRLRKEKCVFRQKSCRYLGHDIDEEGIHPTYNWVVAIKNAPVPQKVQQLRSYLWLIHYYHNFLTNISSLLEPLHELTCLATEWK